MVEPVTWHPSADRATIEALVAEQDRRLVPLTAWLADAGVEAVGSSRMLQVLTPAHSRITYPLELMLRDSGAYWIVREGRERFRDGLTGVRMYWTGTRFAADPDAPIPDIHTPQPGSGDLELQITTVHPQLSSSLQLGGVAQAAMRELTGSDPTGWGVSEPVTHPWSPRELTAFCQDRAPSPSQVVVLGNGVLGQIHVERTRSGVQERVRLSGPRAGVVDAAAIESLAEALAGHADSMTVAANPGRLDGIRRAEVTMPALPYAVLVGRSMVAQRGVAHAEQVPVSRYRILDGACWCRLDTGPDRPYELLTAVCSHFGIIPGQEPG